MKLNIDPNTGKYRALPPSAPRTLTASAVRINFNDPRERLEFTKRVTQKNSWQSQAWDYYDYIGEIKFAANLIANTVSKVHIYPAYSTSDDSIPSAVRHYQEIEEYAPIIEGVFALLKTGISGISGYLRTSALSQFVAGEHYLVREPANPLHGTPERFTARSVDEIYVDSTASSKEMPRIFLKPSPDSTKEEMIPLPEGSYISRMWRNHPRFSSQADSSLRGILDDADDLLTLSREARILSRSRSSASILFLPDTLDDSASPDEPIDEDFDPDHVSNGSDDSHDSVAEYITLALNQAAFEDQHVNHYAPVILRGPAEAGKEIRFIDLSRPMDNLHAKMSEDKLDRILNALDIPKDLAKGLSDLKYNSGALIEDSLYNSHVEPLILLLVDQLTNGFLRPALRAQGVPDEIVERTLIWYNPSAIMAKPTKSQAASFGFENDIISAQAWRDSNGFTEADQPSQEEIARKMLIQKLALDPALSSSLLDKLLPDVMSASRSTTASNLDPNSVNALDQALAPDSGSAPAGPADPSTVPAPIMDSDEAVTLTPEDVRNIQEAGGLDAMAQAETAPSTPFIEPDEDFFNNPEQEEEEDTETTTDQ